MHWEIWLCSYPYYLIVFYCERIKILKLHNISFILLSASWLTGSWNSKFWACFSGWCCSSSFKILHYWTWKGTCYQVGLILFILFTGKGKINSCFFLSFVYLKGKIFWADHHKDINSVFTWTSNIYANILFQLDKGICFHKKSRNIYFIFSIHIMF